jgi:hypothetical protein
LHLWAALQLFVRAAAFLQSKAASRPAVEKIRRQQRFESLQYAPYDR